MSYYPLYVQMAHRVILLVGGGVVAWQKARGFPSDAEIRVVAPDVQTELRDAICVHKWLWHERAYETSDLDGVDLVFAATDDPMLQQRLSRETHERGIWINLADDGASGDFIVPSVVRRGDLTIAVSTQGIAPALAKKVRHDIETLIGPEYADLLAALGPLRDTLKLVPADRRAAFWDWLVMPSTLRSLKEEHAETLRQRLMERLKGPDAF